ncbi:hypothetical protein I0P70_12600 [Pontibacter sp. FD36]|uniref:hypothetical protein n=1 Tax=Pontibacter sp. FD36 TaxID=2789860 RepID=UPI0018AAE225|nr:hypothetical protein [Pontibacter sp. FD36]MBF8964088.1 hypothetical protein [Pontibacter sp. FD36]
MKQFYPDLLLRTPFYPHPTYHDSSLAATIKTPYFRAALQLARPSLYQELEKCSI